MARTSSLSDEQLEIRRGKVMASDLAAYAGLSPWTSPISAWALNLGYEEFEGNDSMSAGIHLETGLINWAVEKLEAKSYSLPGTIFHKQYPWAGCTPDAIVWGAEDKPIGLQIKLHGLWMAADYAGQPGEAGEYDNDLIPAHYLVQCHWEMFVCHGAGFEGYTDEWLLGSYFGGGDFRIYRLKRDDSLIKGLLKFAEGFWKRSLDPAGELLAPPIDGSDSSAAYLRRKFPKSNGNMIKPPAGALEWAERYHSSHAHIAEYTKAKAEAKNTLIQMVGDNDGIEGICTLRAPKASAQTDWEGVAREIFENLPKSPFEASSTLAQAASLTMDDFVKDHTTTKEPGRTFLLKWKPPKEEKNEKA